MLALHKRLFKVVMGVIVFCVFLFVQVVLDQKRKQSQIVVGAKNCTEQHLLSEMIARMLEHHGHFKVIRRYNLR